MDRFCGSAFWDLNKTWYTEDPDFTPCFQKTTLVWVPCGFLWLAATVEVTRLFHLTTGLKVPWAKKNLTSLILIAALVILEVINLIYMLAWHKEFGPLYPADYVAPVIQALTFVLVFCLSVLSKLKGSPSSGVQLLFWFFAFCSGTIVLRSYIRTAEKSGVQEIFPFVSHVIYYTIVTCQLGLSCWSDRSFFPDGAQASPCPQKQASALSRASFFWFSNLAWEGRKKPLELDDLWDLQEENSAAFITEKFNSHWKLRLDAARRRRAQELEAEENSVGDSDGTELINRRERAKKTKVSVLPTVCHVIGPDFLLGAVFRFIETILLFTGPVVLGWLISFVEDNEETWKGYLYGGFMFVVSLVHTIFLSHYYWQMYLVALRVKTALYSIIYKKALLLTNASRKESTVGEIVNLMSVDADHISELLVYLHTTWAAPLQVIIVLYLIWTYLGLSILAGAGVLVLILPLNWASMECWRRLYDKIMAFRDDRAKVMNEVLNGMKILKLYAWESSFEKKVLNVRNKEIGIMRTCAVLSSAWGFLWNSSSFMITIATFATYVMSSSENVLDSKKIFVSLSLFNLLHIPLSMLPTLFTQYAQAKVSLGRINNFLNQEELKSDNVIICDEQEPAILVEKASFKWSEEEEDFSLEEVDLEVPEGSLVGVVGVVGAGKSSLLMAILGEMPAVKGQVCRKGSIAFVAQQAWIQNASVQDNILFGSEMESKRYEEVLETCALKPDLEILPAGDSTEIGEKGVNLSGGQKQRVSLARALYSNADVYLLDDPLSAVDVHVGRHIFDKVIGPQGLLKEKTRILVTQSVRDLPRMDRLVVMSEGRVSEVGSYSELLQKKGAFADFLLQHLAEVQGEEEIQSGEGNNELEELKVDLEKALGGEEELRKKVIHVARQRSVSQGDESAPERRRKSLSRVISRVDSIDEKSEKDEHEHHDHQHGGELVEEEKVETGKVKWPVYTYYLKSVGIIRILVTFLLHAGHEVCTAGSNVWLAKWADASTNGTALPVSETEEFLEVYGFFGIGQAVAGFMHISIPWLGCIMASKILHERMLSRILHCPMHFFETNPSGRILSRFTRDVDSMDDDVPNKFLDLTWCSFELLTIMIMISYTTPIFLTVVLPIGIPYYFVQTMYISSSRQLKRLESKTRSPLFSHFSETLAGIWTIRAYRAESRFIKESEQRIDTYQSCYYHEDVAGRWMSVWLEFVGCLVILFASVFAVMERHRMSPGMVGLSISYSLQVTDMLQWFMLVACEMERDIVSVERIKEYGELPQEAAWELPSDKSFPPNWPSEGHVEFEGYELRYREGLELALKGVNMSVNGGERVGIVGRTGAGKSSLVLALFRIIEPHQGRILVDKVDVSAMGLHTLRRGLTVIPQDPVLFSGSLRSNLDPFESYSDEDIWTALEQAHLKDFVSQLPHALDHTVSEGGDNLSQGQRQLVCLARALLRRTKLLILDEATASIDLDTDDLIQRTIRTEFSGCTVLTIAHRLNTIMDSDRVIVLDGGQVQEFGSPADLLQNETSLFRAMALEANLVGREAQNGNGAETNGEVVTAPAT